VPKKLLPKVRKKRTNTKKLFCFVRSFLAWCCASVSRFLSTLRGVWVEARSGKFSKSARNKRRSGDPEL
jgi:hypothetical protein